MSRRRNYLIVDGHSIIFAWSDLRRMHDRRTSLARDELCKRLRDYQDWSGVHVVLVFDGQRPQVSALADPHDIQIFYSRKGQTADTIVERLASKYGERYHILVATSDNLEKETATACGAECVSPEALRQMLSDARKPGR